MGENEDRGKAEKLAAAKKRVAQLQKKKKAAAAGSSDKPSSSKEKLPTDEVPKSPIKDTAAEAEHEDESTESKEVTKKETDLDEDEAAFNSAIQNATTPSHEEQEDHEIEPPAGIDTIGNAKHRPPQLHGRQPSVSLQSKIRSTSFRQSNGPLSPGLVSSPANDEIPDIYRKQSLRLEELERHNVQLSADLERAESRWRRLEEELEQVREQHAKRRSGAITTTATHNTKASHAEEVAKLQAEISRLTATTRRDRAGSASKSARSGSTPDPSAAAELATLQKQLESKDATISDMSMEISKLRAQMSEKMAGCETHGVQISSLQTSLSSSETRFQNLEAELVDARRSVTRMSERAVREGTEKTSRETRIKELERLNEAATSQQEQQNKQVQGLEKKLEAMGKLHREAEERHAKRQKEVELEGQRLRSEKMKRLGRGGDDVDGDADGVDELEDEERSKLQRRIRDLEGEVFELRKGVYHEQRQGFSTTTTPNGGDVNRSDRPSFEVDGFDDVDLSGSGGTTRRLSSNLLSTAKHSGFSQVFSSGLAAFRGASPLNNPPADQHHRQSSPRQQQQLHHHHKTDSLLLDDDADDDAMFDEAAFAAAQREEEARKMVEHVREVKRKLKDWKGWRLDLVESRRMMGTAASGIGGGYQERGGNGGWWGEIFEV